MKQNPIFTDVHSELDRLAGRAYAIVERFLDDEEEKLGEVDFFITEVPDDVTREMVKHALVKAKRVVGRLTDHGDLRPPLATTSRCFTSDKWPFDLKMQYCTASTEITYDDLLAEANGERKETLRIPIELHDTLASLAKHEGLSLSEYCLKAYWQRIFVLKVRMPSKLSHRDAMRALYRICGDDKEAIVNGWVRLHELKLVSIKKGPGTKDPRPYAQQLYHDALNKNNWHRNHVNDSIVQVVRDAMKEEAQ